MSFLRGIWRFPFARARIVRHAEPALEPYHCRPTSEVLAELGSSPAGLSSAEASQRLARHGPNALVEEERLTRTRVLAKQLDSPLLMLLLFAALASVASGEWVDTAIVSSIALATVGIGYSREYDARSAAQALKRRVKTHAEVLRGGRPERVPMEDVVPGDVVLVSAGSVVPADGLVLEATDCHVSESMLTGESFPSEKHAGPTPADAPLGRRDNVVFLGTNVRSGNARCLIVRTGALTEFGKIAHRLKLRPPETDFDRGIRRFGYLLTSAMSFVVLLVFVVHVAGGRPAVETLLFAIALAVGLSPELLPAILTINLSRAAALMAQQGVLVRRLNAIENLGSMDILCTDKTGTLTDGVVRLDGAFDAAGNASDEVLTLAITNAALETGLPSPLDDAILAARPVPHVLPEKLREIPFDFLRKRVSVVVRDALGVRLVTKGAFAAVLAVSSRMADGTPLGSVERAALEAREAAWARAGVRVLAVAVRTLPERSHYGRSDECDLEFMGFLTFLDRPKQGVARAIEELSQLGVSIKVISGDSRHVTEHVAEQVGLERTRVLTGADLDQLHDEALWHAAERTDLFVEVDPNQKERILLALKKTGHVVGFLGDGVNDAPAMHAADASISVDQAADVARAAADFVLLERHLDVIRRGIEEGRRTFANTNKYVLTTTSANLGNMFSMALASLFLPFLPLLAGQILLNNFLSDIPAVGIADDTVDPELVTAPRRWDMRFIARFMVEFGLLSSAFDLFTFALLTWVFRAEPAAFRTGWFVESLLTELVIALVVRTRRPFFRSRPGTLLLVSTALLVPIAFAIPFFPYAGTLGFVPLPLPLLAALAALTAFYVLSTEVLKSWFYRAMPRTS